MVTPTQLGTSTAARKGHRGSQRAVSPKGRGVLSPILIAAMTAVVGVGLGGCDQWVKVNVPKDVQRATGAPAVLPLPQALAAQEEYRDIVEAEGKKAAAEELERREEARAAVVALRNEIEAEAAQRDFDAAAFVRKSEQRLAAMEAAENARARAADSALARLRDTWTATDAQMDRRIAEGRASVEGWRGVVADGVEMVKPVVGTLPGGGLVLGAIGLLTGWLGLKRPKDGAAEATATADKKAAEARADELAAQVKAMQDRLDAMLKKADDDFEDGFEKGRAPFVKEVHTVVPQARAEAA